MTAKVQRRLARRQKRLGWVVIESDGQVFSTYDRGRLWPVFTTRQAARLCARRRGDARVRRCAVTIGCAGKEP